MKRIFFFLFFLLPFLQNTAQIKENERLTFAASYNMSGLMTQLAQVTMETKTATTSRSAFLHLKIQASTFSQWDSYFRIRDVFESYVNPKTLVPSLYRRDVNEGGYTKIERYVYSADGRTVNATVSRKNAPEQTRSFTKKPSSVDIVAAIYQMRTVDFSQFKIGQTHPMDIVFDEKEFSAQVKYMGKETISIGKLGRVECYKLSLSAAGTDVLRGKDRNLVWITADERRIPVFIQFSIPVGTGQLMITEIK